MRIPPIEEQTLKKLLRSEFEKNGVNDELINRVTGTHALHAFYSTRILLQIGNEDRLYVLEKLAKNFPCEENIHKIEYLKYAFSLSERYYRAASDLASDLSAEDLIYCFEYLLTRIRVKKISVDGNVYPDDILDSQYGHLMTTLAETFSFIRNNRITFCGSASLGKRKRCQEFVLVFNQYESIQWQIIEVLHSSYVPRPPKTLASFYNVGEHDTRIQNYAKFYLQRTPINWRRIETYRDLNYDYSYRTEKNINHLERILRNADVLRSKKNASLMRFDFSNVEKFESELKFHKVEQFLEPIYGDLSTSFEYKGKNYEIQHLVNVARSISDAGERLGRELAKKTADGTAKYVRAIGAKSFARALAIGHNECELLDLFCFDFSSVAKLDPRYLPLLRNGDIYYLLASHISTQCYEKVIDKILSRPEIKVLIKNGKHKGHVFEKQLETLLKSAQYEWGHVNADSKKNIPEIDGIFLLSADEVVVYEAKCSIKPEERDDAYSFVENHLVKAATQLHQRVRFLHDRTDEAEERLQFDLKGKRITPMIITNHSYFTGAGPITVDDINISIIDYELFSQIVVRKTAPKWNYDPQKLAYSREEHLLVTTTELLAALTNPVQFLNSMVPTTLQIGESGMVYEISKTPAIEYF